MLKGHIETKGKNKYRLNCTVNGHRFRQCIDANDKKEAERKLIIWLEKIEKGELKAPEYTVSEFADVWLEKQIKPNTSGNRTYNKYRIFLDNWFIPNYGNIYINKITKKDMTEYFNWLKQQKTKYSNRNENKQLSPDTLKKYKAILHAMFQTAVEWEKININPCSVKVNFYNNVEQRHDTRVDYYRYNEYINILEIVDKEKEIVLNNDKDKLLHYSRLVILELALKTGLRRSEIFGLTKSIKDVDLDEKMLDVNKTRQYSKENGKELLVTKTIDSPRKVSIPKSLISTLETLINLLPENTEFLFEDISIDGTSNRWFHTFQSENGIRRIRFHDLRHTHASVLLYKGVDIKIISNRLGHSYINTTIDTYLHIIRELNQKVSEIIDEL